MFWIAAIGIALGAYLLGSFPTGYLVGRARGIDIRTVGSGNIGATNALRVLGKKWGYLVFAGDIFKGWLAVVLARVISPMIGEFDGIAGGLIAAMFVMIGHSFPVWLGFNGGKGIATSGGIMLGLFPIWVFAFGLAVWLGLFFTTRYVSVASLGAAVSLPASSGFLMLYGLTDWRLTTVAGLMCILALWRHKSNIERLLAGTEKKFEKKKADPPAANG